jgi:hypothetical protein
MKFYLDSGLARTFSKDGFVIEVNSTKPQRISNYINIENKEDREKLNKIILQNNFELTKLGSNEIVILSELPNNNQNYFVKKRAEKSQTVARNNRNIKKVESAFGNMRLPISFMRRNNLEVPNRNNNSGINGKLNLERTRLERLGCRRLPNSPNSNIVRSYLCDSHYTEVLSYSLPMNTLVPVKSIFDTGNASHTIVDREIVKQLKLPVFPILATKEQISKFNSMIDKIIRVQEYLTRGNIRVSEKNRKGLFSLFIENPHEYKIQLININSNTPKKVGIHGINRPTKEQIYDKLRKITYKRTTMASLYDFVNRNKLLIQTIIGSNTEPILDSKIYNLCGISYTVGVGGAITVITEEVIIPFSIPGIDNENGVKKYFITAGVNNTSIPGDIPHILFSNKDIDKLSFVGINIGKCIRFSEFRESILEIEEQIKELVGFSHILSSSESKDLTYNIDIMSDIEKDINQLSSRLESFGYLRPEIIEHS